MPMADSRIRLFIFVRAEQFDQLFSGFSFDTDPRAKVCEHGASGVSPMVHRLPFLRIEGTRKRLSIGATSKVEQEQKDKGPKHQTTSCQMRLAAHFVGHELEVPRIAVVRYVVVSGKAACNRKFKKPTVEIPSLRVLQTPHCHTNGKPLPENPRRLPC